MVGWWGVSCQADRCTTGDSSQIVQLHLLPWNKLPSLLPSSFFFLFSFAEYLTQVDLEKEKETQEIKAREEFDKGERKATIVVELLEKLSKPSQIALYYCGGLEILSQALTDCECSNNCVSPLITLFTLSLVFCFSGAPICWFYVKNNIRRRDFRLDWLRRREALKEITIICS